MAEKKPSVLILGGVGFIGRNVVHYIVQHELASKVRVADKVLPGMAWMNKAHMESFKQVEFKHANLINAKSVENAFKSDGPTFDFIINCAGETKFGQSEPVYRDGILKLSTNCAKEAAKLGVKKYVEISSSRMCSSEKKPMTESVHCEPWTQHARYKLQVEQELSNIPGLNFVIVRPAIVYGIGDKSGLTPRLVIGAVYKYLKEKMMMLWTKEVKMNTVHVTDVSRALWHLCLHGRIGDIYNIVDKACTNQGMLTKTISEVFKIKYDFLGSVMSSVAKLSLEDVVQEVNEKHMVPWGQACQKSNILTTPLNPFIHPELLSNKPLYIDGSKMEATGFIYEKPELTADLLQEVLHDYVELGLFPASLAKGS